MLCIIFWLDLRFISIRFILYFFNFNGCFNVFVVKNVVNISGRFNVIKSDDFYVCDFYCIFFVFFSRFSILLVNFELYYFVLIMVDLLLIREKRVIFM